MAEQSKSGGDAGSPNKVPIKQDNNEKTKIGTVKHCLNNSI
jgi:hypothetical protein